MHNQQKQLKLMSLTETFQNWERLLQWGSKDFRKPTLT